MKKLEVKSVILGADGPDSLLLTYNGIYYIFKDGDLVHIDEIGSLILAPRKTKKVMETILGDIKLTDIEDTLKNKEAEEVKNDKKIEDAKEKTASKLETPALKEEKKEEEKKEEEKKEEPKVKKTNKVEEPVKQIKEKGIVSLAALYSTGNS